MASAVVWGSRAYPAPSGERYRARSAWQRKYYTGREAPTPPPFTALSRTGDTSHTVYYSFLFSQTGALALFDVQHFLADNNATPTREKHLRVPLGLTTFSLTTRNRAFPLTR